VAVALQSVIESYRDQFWAGPLPWHEWLVARGLTPQTAQAVQLGYVGTPATEKHGRFVGALAIPFFSGTGKPLGIRFRHPDGHRPKYDQPAGQPPLPYLLKNLESRIVYVTEGEFDSLILTQLGLPAVGIPGANAFREEWRYLFRDCERAVIVFDGDEAGRGAAAKVARIIGEVNSVTVVEMPEGQDITDFYLAHGPEALTKRVRGGD
jgi:DNA primase